MGWEWNGGRRGREPSRRKTGEGLGSEETLNGVCERVGVIGINTVFPQIGAEPQRGRGVRE